MRNRAMIFRPILYKVLQEIIVYMAQSGEVSNKPLEAQLVRKLGQVETINSISITITSINPRILES
jgi:DNA-binding TFAR19-related protein (PDSD5 family)